MARTELPHGVILPAEYSDDWYEDMTSNLTKLDDVIGSDADKLSEGDVARVAMTGEYSDIQNTPDLSPYNTHIADSNIHVTAADKTTWNTVTSKADDNNVMHLTGDESAAGNKNFEGLLTTIPDSTLWPSTTNTTDDITYLSSYAIHAEQKSSGKLRDLSGGAWNVVELGAGCFFFRNNNGADIRYKNLPLNTVNRIAVVSNANRQLNNLTPETDNTYSLGDSTRRWKTINNINPGALSLPSSTSLDISAYITDLSGQVNNYSAPADGWVYVRITGTGIRLGNTNGIGQSANRETSGTLACSVPVCAGDVVNMYIVGTSVAAARFHACRGNV